MIWDREKKENKLDMLGFIIGRLVRWPAPVRFCGALNDREWGRGPTSA